MYHDYFFKVLMREREREILKDLGGGGYHVHRRRGASGLFKKNIFRLLPIF